MIRKICFFIFGAFAFLVLGVVLAHFILIGGIYASKTIKAIPPGKVVHPTALAAPIPPPGSE